MKRTSKLLAIVLTLCMVIALCPTVALAETQRDITFDKYTFTTSETEVRVPIGAGLKSVEGASHYKVDSGNMTEIGFGFTVSGNTITFYENDSATTALVTMTVVDPAIKATYPSEIANKLANSCLANAASGTIKLTADMTVTGCVAIAAGSDITLDLNGHKLTSSNGTYTVHARGANVSGKAASSSSSDLAKLTIVGSGTIENTSAGSTVIDADVNSVINIGTATTNAGFPSIVRAATSNGSNSAIKGDETSAINIYGGVFTNDSTVSQRSIQSYGTTKIYGGTFNDEVQAWTWEDHASSLTIIGGDFKAAVTGGHSAKGSGFTGTPVAPTLTISGGTFSDMGWVPYATSGASVKLGANIILTDTLAIDGKTFTLDLNGKTITCDPGERKTAINIGASTASTITLKDSAGGGKITSSTLTDNFNLIAVRKNSTLHYQSGKLEVSTAAKAIQNQGTVNMTGGTISSPTKSGLYSDGGVVTISNGSISGKWALDVRGGAQVAVSGGTITGTDAAITGIGTDVAGTTTITVSAGTITGTDVGIYHPQSGTLTISGGTISGKTGIEVKGGTATISGSATISATGSISHASNSNGNSTSGYAVAVVENAGYATDGRAVSATIEGGKYSGPVAKLLDSVRNGEETLTITGGYFTADPSEYIVTPPSATKNNVAITSDINGYNYMVGAAAINAEIAVAAPKVETALPGAAPSANVEAANAVAAALAPTDSSAPVVEAEGLEGAANTVVATLPVGFVGETNLAALNGAIGNSSNVGANDVHVYVQPYLDIKVKGVEVGEAGQSGTPITEITLDIKPMVKTVISTANDADDINFAGDVGTTNAVEVGTAREVTVTAPVTITIPLPANFVTTGTFQIKHVKGNGDIYYYTATIAGSEGAKTATFTVTNGFSEFTVMAADTRTLTVNFDRGVASKTYSITNVGETLPVPAIPSGFSSFNGWAYDGRVYTTLPDVWSANPSETFASTGYNVTAQFTPIYYGPSTPTRNPGMQNFKSDAAKYTAGMFTDVDTDAWYGDSKEACVKNVVMLGIMDGYGDGIFKPEASLKVSEAIKMACMVYSIYANDGEKFTQGEPWYQVYVDYAVKNGIIKAGDFANLDAVCTRAEAAYIFAHALPAKELAAKNIVSTLPDVSTGDKYASEIFLLYRAGVLGGNDDIGTFGADGAFNRAQAAAVIYRLCIPAARQTLSF